MKQRGAMSLLELPNELLLLIADHLPMTGLSGLRRTCSRIYKVLKRLNRKRIVMDDVMSLADLEIAVLSPRSRNRLRCATYVFAFLSHN
jgi:F-box-like